MSIRNLFLLLVLFIATGCSSDPLQDLPIDPPNPDSHDGPNVKITLTDELRDFTKEVLVCYLQTANGEVIKRSATHRRFYDTSHVEIKTGVKDGIYRLLYVEYQRDERIDKFTTARKGVGRRVEAKNGQLRLLGSYNSELGFSSDSTGPGGTKENPYNICVDYDLVNLKNIVNDHNRRDLIDGNTHFKQVCDIAMDWVSFECSKDYGWNSIGDSETTPFISHYDGRQYSITKLRINRVDSHAIGLFGFICGATLQNIHVKEATIKGGFAVGAIAGGTIKRGDVRSSSLIRGCTVTASSIASKAMNEGVSIGGILGFVDIDTKALVDSCRLIGRENHLSGAYAVGGIVGSGATYSALTISNCHNEGGTVKGGFSCVGGILGSADTISIMSCGNKAAITGGLSAVTGDQKRIGVGGITGGSGMGSVVACVNEGTVEGVRGVGGIVGSTLVGGSGKDDDPYVYNNVMIVACRNLGAISGEHYIGGLCGEAQLGAYGSYNKSTVSATSQNSFVGGIVGGGSIAALNNCYNFSDVKGVSHCGGIAGGVLMGSLANLHNFGKVNGEKGRVGGIIGLTGSSTMVTYSSNMGILTNLGSGAIGGIVGEIGEKRKWTTGEITSCVFTALESTFYVLGGWAFSIAGNVVGKGAKVFLKTAEIAINTILTRVDATLLALDIASIAGPDHSEIISTSMKQTLQFDYKLITNELNKEVDRRFNTLPYVLPKGLPLNGIVSNYNNNRKSLISFFENSIENEEHYNDNINRKRDERYDAVKDTKQTENIAHAVIGGICIAVSFVIIIAGTAATGGTATALLLAGTATAIVGGANSISKTVDNFAENASVVSQCINVGPISASNSSHAGGIIGHMRQFIQVKNCMNAGDNTNRSNGSGGVSGETEERTEVINCLNIGAGWDHALYLHAAYMDGHNNYFLNNGYGTLINYKTEITVNELKNADTFKPWNMEENKLWEMTDNYPVPLQSEMQQ